MTSPEGVKALDPRMLLAMLVNEVYQQQDENFMWTDVTPLKQVLTRASEIIETYPDQTPHKDKILRLYTELSST